MANAKSKTVTFLGLAGVVALLVYLIQSNSKLRNENLALRDRAKPVER